MERILKVVESLQGLKFYSKSELFEIANNYVKEYKKVFEEKPNYYIYVGLESDDVNVTHEPIGVKFDGEFYGRWMPFAKFQINRFRNQDNEIRLDLKLIYDFRNTEGSLERFDDELSHSEILYNSFVKVVENSVKSMIKTLLPEKSLYNRTPFFGRRFKNLSDEESKKYNENLQFEKEQIDALLKQNGILCVNHPFCSVKAFPYGDKTRLIIDYNFFDRGYDSTGDVCSSVGGFTFVRDYYNF